MQNSNKNSYRNRRSNNNKRKPKMNAKQRQVKTMARQIKYRTNIFNKLFKMNTANYYFGVREANEIDDQVGKVVLQDNSLADELPLHVIPLCNIVNNNSASAGLLKLKHNGHDFTQAQPMDLMSVGGQISITPTSAETNSKFQKLLQRYIDAKFCLWSSASKKINYEITLVQIKDEQLNPLNLVTTDVDTQNVRKAFYKLKMLRHQVSNPIVKGERIDTSIKNKYRVLWRKSYQIEEQHGDVDEKHYKVVKFFKKTDVIKDYADGIAYVPTATSYADADFNVRQTNDVNFKSAPDVRQNLFLIITANLTKSYDDNNSSFETASYDLNTICKYTSVGSTGI